MKNTNTKLHKKFTQKHTKAKKSHTIQTQNTDKKEAKTDRRNQTKTQTKTQTKKHKNTHKNLKANKSEKHI